VTQPDDAAAVPGGPDIDAADVVPRFPQNRSGVAILGCGGIAQSAHLPAYERYGVGVRGVWSRTRARTGALLERFPMIGGIYDTAEDLLADPEVRIVDIATGPEVRLRWVAAAVEAGKHVLAQKPLTLDAGELAEFERLASAAAERGLRIAVNYNARWAPPWRMTTLLLRRGTIGAIVGVTHLHDKPLPPLAGTRYDDVPHMLVTDYLVHWLDITRCWLADGSEGDAAVCRVVAVDGRVPGQPADARNPWSAVVVLQARGGASATIRVVGNAVANEPGCPFWVHGTGGTLRGSVLLGSDRLTLDRGDGVTCLPLQGAWFVDGFAGAMGELMCAIADNREPENSLRDGLATARLALAARDSAERDGAPVELGSTPR
jgi:predicted dehydrogenase